MTVRSRILLGLLPLFATGPRPAEAHGTIEGAGAFYGGLLHPFTVPEHLLVMLALALGTSSLDAARPGLLSFAVTLIAGELLAIALGASGIPAILLIVAALSIALCVVIGRPLPIPVLLAMAVLAGLSIGLDFAPESGTVSRDLVAAAGTLLGAGIAILFATERLLRLRRDWQRVGVRVAASWVVAISLLVGALEFAPGPGTPDAGPDAVVGARSR